jgi:hypothetical protein
MSALVLPGHSRASPATAEHPNGGDDPRMDLSIFFVRNKYDHSNL